jgi:hypothetical protein
LVKCQGTSLTLSNGVTYSITSPVADHPAAVWAHSNHHSDCILLYAFDTPPAEIVYDDVFFGEMHWHLTFYDSARRIAVYATYAFAEDLEDARIGRGETRMFLRNIGYRGLVAVFSDRTRVTLNAPPGGFPVTSVSTNYDWVYEAHFPQSPATVPYGHYVFAIFARAGLRFRSTIRTGSIVDPYFAGKRIREFSTADPIYYHDALLLTSARDYAALQHGGAGSRAQALALLNRTEEAQVVWEQEVLEEAKSVLDIPMRVQDMQGVVPTPLYTSLLRYRAYSPVTEGMLLHLHAPQASNVLLSGEFLAWADSPAAGAILMTRVSASDWAAVVPAAVAAPREQPYTCKFLIEHSGVHAWANGLYLVDHHDPLQNSFIRITGHETLYSQQRAAARLEWLARGERDA